MVGTKVYSLKLPIYCYKGDVEGMWKDKLKEEVNDQGLLSRKRPTSWTTDDDVSGDGDDCEDGEDGDDADEADEDEEEDNDQGLPSSKKAD